MKTNKLHRLLPVILFCCCVFGISLLMAQNDEKNVSTNISYKVDFGPVYPIEGKSYQIVGKVALNEVTGEPESIGFEVPLNSFIGQNQGYLAWVGNSWDNPDLVFSSTGIIQKDDTHYTVNGRLEFRRKPAPIQINFIKRDNDNEIILDGDFQMTTNDYFIISPPNRLVPAWIPFKVTLVFDKPARSSGQISFH